MKNWILIPAVLVVYIIIESFTVGHTEDDKRQQQQQVLVNVGRMLAEKHYSPRTVDDVFSREVWRYYLEQLDPEKRIFLQEDITAMEKYATTLDEEIHGTTPIAFLPDVVTVFTERLGEVEKEYHQLLTAPLHFTEKGETLEKNTGYPVDMKARKTAGSKYVKYQVLKNLVLLQDQRTHSKKGDPLFGITNVQLEKQARTRTVQQLDRTFAGIKSNLSEEKQFDVFVNVIVRAMDPHTDFFPPVAQAEFNDVLRNRFIGIGVQLQPEEGVIKVVELEPGGPAWKSGQIAPNDLILQVGEGTTGPMVDITGMLPAEVSKLIRGAKGTTVRLDMKKVDGSIKTVPLVRDEIIQEEGFARAAVINKGTGKTGYIVLPKFYIDPSGKTDVHCSKDIAKAVTALKAAKVDGIVLDLRSNGGGSLDEVIKMVGLFIKAGPVVQVRNNTGKIMVLKDMDSSLLYDGPLVVMVNEMSASAAEIFAAAIQDYHRGIIVGSPATYGKGTVQGTFSLAVPGSGGLKLTFQKFYRINGGSTQINGVVPDIILPDTYEHLKIREKDNPDALVWDQVDKADYTLWENGINFSAIKQQEDQQIAQDGVFNALNRISLQLGDEQYGKKYLNLSDYKAQQDAHKKIQSQALQLQQLPAGKEMDISAVARTGTSAGQDSLSAGNYQEWINKLKTDIYINEALKIEDHLAAK